MKGKVQSAKSPLVFPYLLYVFPNPVYVKVCVNKGCGVVGLMVVRGREGDKI